MRGRKRLAVVLVGIVFVLFGCSELSFQVGLSHGYWCASIGQLPSGVRVAFQYFNSADSLSWDSTEACTEVAIEASIASGSLEVVLSDPQGCELFRQTIRGTTSVRVPTGGLAGQYTLTMTSTGARRGRLTVASR